MRFFRAVALAIVVCLQASGSTRAENFFLAMDRQVDVGFGSAIGPDEVIFTSDPSGGFARFFLEGGSYYWGPTIDFQRAGFGTVDLSNPTATIEFEARYYQDPADYPPGTPWNNHDAPLGVLLMSPTAGVAYGYPYHSTWGDPPYPTWTHVRLDVNVDASPKVQRWAWWGTLDMAEITSIQFWGTDWPGTGADFIDVRNLSITTAVPEIDSAGMGSVLALVTGALGLLERRRVKAA